mgnify:CR=1 FL=1
MIFIEKYKLNKFLEKNLNPDADERTVEENIIRQNRKLIVAGTVIAIVATIGIVVAMAIVSWLPFM